MPKSMCDTCLASLVGAYEFQQQCITADREIRQCLGIVVDDMAAADIADTTTTPQKVEDGFDSTALEPLVAVVKTEKTEDDDNGDDGQLHWSEPNSPAEQKTKSKPYECDLCPTKFSVKADLLSHTLEEHGNKNSTSKSKKKLYPCLECDKVFEYPYRLARHGNVHDNSKWKPYECELCKRSFVSKEKLTGHMKKEHLSRTDLNDLTKIEYDDDDATVAATTEYLDDEKPAIETDDKSTTNNIFTCLLCGKIFKSQYHLRRHGVVHNNSSKAKRYECDICKERFVSKIDLSGHMNSTHAFEGSLDAKLLKYRRIHESQNFKCNLCEKGRCNFQICFFFIYL